jgi:sugar phosphate isomerase/epimerase
MELAVTSDYATDSGDPSPYLRHIADAGFTHVHWCHQWSTDFAYSRYEISAIRRWLRRFGLRLLDLHGTTGREKNWASETEWARRSGVELAKNRIAMTARLGADVVVQHLNADAVTDPLRRSLDELERYARRLGVRLAIENTGRFDVLAELFDLYGPDYTGLCYDSGHANLANGGGIDALEPLKDRLIAVHLHDNDTTGDQHKLPFMGSVDWKRLMPIIAASSYRKCLSLEVSMTNSGFTDDAAFLQEAHRVGEKLVGMMGRRA